jgi:pentatricopeptide repeat protein
MTPAYARRRELEEAWRAWLQMLFADEQENICSRPARDVASSRST